MKYWLLNYYKRSFMFLPDDLLSCFPFHFPQTRKKLKGQSSWQSSQLFLWECHKPLSTCPITGFRIWWQFCIHDSFQFMWCFKHSTNWDITSNLSVFNYLSSLSDKSFPSKRVPFCFCFFKLREKILFKIGVCQK